MEVRQRMVEQFNHIDHDLAKQVAMGIGVKPPMKSEAPDIGKSSPAVSMAGPSRTPSRAAAWRFWPPTASTTTS
jgi:catalase